VPRPRAAPGTSCHQEYQEGEPAVQEDLGPIRSIEPTVITRVRDPCFRAHSHCSNTAWCPARSARPRVPAKHRCGIPDRGPSPRRKPRRPALSASQGRGAENDLDRLVDQPRSTKRRAARIMRTPAGHLLLERCDRFPHCCGMGNVGAIRSRFPLPDSAARSFRS